MAYYLGTRLALMKRNGVWGEAAETALITEIFVTTIHQDSLLKSQKILCTSQSLLVIKKTVLGLGL